MIANIQRADTHLLVTGAMTLETASALLANGVQALSQDDLPFDLAGVTDVDSSGLSVLFGWQRAAMAQGKTLRVAHPPHNLVSLAAVYGVTELLPLA
jgi:phospholipid transport system transporter-binding protein